MADSGTRRFLIATGTTRYPNAPGLDDRPELADEVGAIRGLFGPTDRDTLGYQIVPGFGPDLASGELKAKLRGFLTARERTAEDFLIFYYTGHGEVDDSGEFLLPFPDTSDDVAGTAVPASELARWLMVSTPVQRLLIILDTCHAGAAGSDLAVRAIAALGRLAALASRPHFAILTATRPREVARAGAFTQALTRAVRHRATGGHEPRFLALDAVLDVINADPVTPASQHARLFSQGEAAAEFLPNPRYNQWLRGLDLRTQLDREQRSERDREFQDHVLPRAAGLDAPREGLWLFTGRHAALGDLSTWLRGINLDGRTRVVTGDPGSGKSAVLARMTVLARPEHLRKVPRSDQLPPETLPPRESIDVFIHARGRTGEQVLGALCSAAGVEAGRPGDLLAALNDRERPFVAVIDALDEATDPDHLAGKVLAPLIRGAPHSKLRLMLGTRRHLIDRLGGPIECVNLDAPKYADPTSVRAYVRSCLLALVADSPYRALEDARVEAVAEAVGDAAGRSFLVALITSRSLAMRPDVANPYDSSWRAALPRFAADAMRIDLDQRLGGLATKARDLLRPLAYALGSGLPWEDIWAPLASALAGRSYTNADLDWLVREAGFYVVEALEGTRSVYRLYHEALAEHLRGDSDAGESHRTIVAFLIQRTPMAGGRLAWAVAHPYARTHLATHAATAGVLDDLVLDPTFLLNAERAPLLANLPATQNTEARAAARAYRRTIRHLRDKPDSEHAAYLELAARCSEADSLATRIGTYGLPRPWRTTWAQWVHPSRDSVLIGHSADVRAIAICELDEGPVVISGSDDGTARVWDLATGTPIGQPFAGHRGSVRAVQAGRVNERPVAVSGGDDRAVWVWDPVTGAPIKGPFVGHDHYVRAVSIGDFEDRAVLISGSFDNTVRVWDLATGKPIGRPFTGHYGGIVAVAAATSTWRPVVVSAAADGTTKVWDLISGMVVRTLSARHKAPVIAMAVAELDHRAVVVTITGSFDNRVQAWDLASGEPFGTTIEDPGSLARSLAIGQLDRTPIVVTGHDDGSVRVWDLARGRGIGEFTRHRGSVCALSVSRLDDLPVVVSGGEDRTIRVLDLARGNRDTGADSAHLSGLRAIATGLIGDRQVVASGGEDRTVRLWDARSGAPVGVPLVGHTDSVRAVAMGTMDGVSVVASGGDDRSVRVWTVEAGDIVTAHMEFDHGWQVRQVAIVMTRASPIWGGAQDGSISPIVVSGAQDGSIRMWNLRTGRPLSDIGIAYLHPVLAVAVGRYNGPVVRVERPDQSHLWGPSYYHRSFFMQTEGDADGMTGQFATLDGETLLLTGGRSGTLNYWRLHEPKKGFLGIRSQARVELVHSEPGDRPISALAHGVGQAIAVARGSSIECGDRTIQLDAEITALAFAEGGTLIVATKQGLAALDLKH